MDVEEEKVKKPEEEQHPLKRRRRRRRLINLKKLYSCVKHEKHDLVGSEGYSRVVICNSPLDTEQPKYQSNYVSTTKYNAITFIPKGLFEQFRRVSNIYFLVAAALSLTSISPFSPLSLITPLIFVIGVSMGKESIEDWKRFRQDQEVNNRLVKVHTGDGTFADRKWKELRVGDVVQVVKDNFFPADLLMLSSNYEDGSCYVETMNLDGETNLKLKKALDITSDLDEEIKFQSFKAVVKCEDPNPNLYSFIGNSEFADELYPLGPQQILLRDSKLRNTDHIYGVVIFTGYDTKVMQNARGPPSKRSGIERKMDLIIYFLLCMLFIISAIGSVVFGVRTANEMPKWWYLRPDNTISSYDPERPVISALLHLITAMMLYGYLIPISLYVSIEIVKVLQVMFINMDIQIYHEDTDRPTQARTSNLNEELGQVDTILSDKTGTLTCNMMEFLKCSVSGTSYGFGVTEVERAAAKRFGKSVAELEDNTSMYDEVGDDDEKSSDPTPPSVKGFNFRDKRLMNGHWAKEKHADSIQMFFRILSVCHTAIPQEDSETGTVTYEVESPDEGALVVAAQQFGFEFYKRTQNSVSVREHNPQSNTAEEREYQILEVLEFSSARKRMSVIIRSVTDGQIFLFCKGSDSVVIERLSADGREWEGPTQQHINKYADSGLRTLAFAYRKLSEDEYKSWSEEYSRAKTHVGADHDAKLDEASDLIEKELILAGATAVEDKLQKGVPECIDRLAQAGIKIWVLTGDKMETAINIGFACSLLRQGMIQLIVTLENEAVKIAEASGDKDQIKKVSREMIKQQIREGMEQVEKSEGSDAVFALIIDGKSLNFALEKDMKDNLLQLAIGCASVICCRVSPKQKAQITRLVKEGTRKTTLAVGDGANDVGMIQEADIGVGISGLEGMQAVMASDFAIAQFRFLERLLLVHGNWCYKRITLMICYFFYKNITFGLTLFYYEAYTVFSAQTAYNDWYLALFNVFFTSLPVIALGVLEQDLSAGVKIQFPSLYQEGVQNMLFGWDRILGWMGNGVSSSLIIFFLVINILRIQAFNQGGHESGYAEMGTTMYTCLIWVVNCQIALAMKYFTWINHVLIWGSILVWYIFLIAYGAIPPSISTTAFQIFVEACAPAPLYWLTAPIVVLATLFPYFCLATLQHWISPMDYHIVLEMVHFNKSLNGNNNSVKRASIGFTAGVDAKIKHWKERLHHRKHRQHNGAQH